jgi:1-aminocyclopropane-1-carboxylate deaminase
MRLPSPVEQIHLLACNNRNIKLFVKRDDLIHDTISGNKWRKLKFNLKQCQALKHERILTFGGAYSNHLLATAAACQKEQLLSIGIVRGEELNSESNHMLQQCESLGMQLVFVSRDEYALRHEKEYHEELVLRFPGAMVVPEGGANYYGMIGCQEIMAETENDFDYIVVAQGTSTTSCGILLSIPEQSRLVVVPVIKGFDSLGEMRKLFSYSGFPREIIDELLEQVHVMKAHHFGGYAKYTTELLDRMKHVFHEMSVPLDPIYTGKAFVAMLDFIEENDLRDVKILFVHTGGIAGGKSIEKAEGRCFS